MQTLDAISLHTNWCITHVSLIQLLQACESMLLPQHCENRNSVSDGPHPFFSSFSQEKGARSADRFQIHFSRRCSKKSVNAKRMENSKNENKNSSTLVLRWGGTTSPFCPTLGPTSVASHSKKSFESLHMSAIIMRSDSYNHFLQYLFATMWTYFPPLAQAARSVEKNNCYKIY